MITTLFDSSSSWILTEDEVVQKIRDHIERTPARKTELAKYTKLIEHCRGDNSSILWEINSLVRVQFWYLGALIKPLLNKKALVLLVEKSDQSDIICNMTEVFTLKYYCKLIKEGLLKFKTKMEDVIIKQNIRWNGLRSIFIERAVAICTSIEESVSDDTDVDAVYLLDGKRVC